MRFMIAAVALLMLSGQAQAGTNTSPLGPWVTASGNLVVDIEPCGPMLCGKVAEVLANRSMEDSAKTIAAKASPGMTILSDLAPAGENAWQGHIFNRENGKTYDCLVSVAGPRELNVRPYVFVSMIGQTQIWRRP